MPKDERFKNYDDNNPGPTDYENVIPYEAPHFKFRMEQRAVVPP